jgi:putative membrane protein
MKMTTESFSSLSTMARLGAAGVILGAAALTGFAQSSSSSSATTSTRAARADTRSEREMKRDMKHDAEAAGMSRQDRKFIEKFTAANQREIALSQLALERATNAQVKAFAQKMVSDHSMAGHEFMTVASGGTLTTDSSLSASTTERASSVNSSTANKTAPTSDHSSSMADRNDKDARGHTAASTTERSVASATGRTSAMNVDAAKNDRAYKKLMDKNGQDFDEAYMKAMVDEHEDAVDMLEDIVKDDDRNAQLRAFANKTLPNLRAHLSEAKQIEKAID